MLSPSASYKVRGGLVLQVRVREYRAVRVACDAVELDYRAEQTTPFDSQDNLILRPLGRAVRDNERMSTLAFHVY